MTAPVGTKPPKAKKPRKAKILLEAVPDDGHPGNSKFARALGSVDYQTREKGLAALARWLVRRTDLRESDMMKIWKGLFYCFWHSDKAPVQLELAERLAAMLTQLSEQSAYMFFAAFLATMRREWFGIDRLRLDKFLMLIRKFVNRMLACLQAANWRSDLVQRYSDYLRDHVVNPKDTLSAAGLAYHLGDVLLAELRVVAGDKPVPGATLAAMLTPFCLALQTGEQAVLNRIGEGVFDTLLSELANPSDDSPYLQQLDVAALAAQLFELGAAPSTRARNRQVLYDLSNSLERMQRKRQRLDTGAQAGPSTEAKPAGKAAKKQQKQRVAAPDAEEAVPAAQPEEKAEPSAAAKRAKRKASNADASEPNGVQPDVQGAQGAVEKEEQPQPKEQTTGKKKKRLQAEAGGDAGETPAAAAPTTVSTAAGVKAAGTPSAAAKASTREPTSGQKAALRAAVAKVGQTPVGKPPKAKEAAEEAKQQEQGDAEATAPTLTPASTPTAVKASALGKRAAPGSILKKATGTKSKPLANGTATKAAAQAEGDGANGHAPQTAKKNRVVINLKKNLYFEHGGPVPDPDVRTPPPARAKGGILKKSAKTCPPKMASSAAASGAQRQQQAGGRVLPKKARRASAALFF